MNYKIIGYFEESGTVWTDQIISGDPHGAMFEASKLHCSGDLQIVCAIGTDGEITCPCEDSGTTASAETLYQNGAVVKWTINGDEQECSLREWIDANSYTEGMPDFDVWQATEDMEAGRRVTLGGGAQPLIECWMPCWMPEAPNAA